MRLFFTFLLFAALCRSTPAAPQASVGTTVLQIPITGATGGLVVNRNPHSRGTGQKVVGFVLLGTGGLSLGLGALVDASDYYADTYKDSGMREFGNGLEKAIWVEGIVRAGLGMVFVVAGYAKHSRWKAWERENRPVSLHLRGTRLVFDF
jgi:hypothetical protein